MRSIIDNPFKMKKLRQDLKIYLKEGGELDGKLFVGYNERILDVFNDDREFIPVEDQEGRIFLLAKSAIKMVDTYQVTGFNAPQAEKSNPIIKKTIFEWLHVADNSSTEFLKERYVSFKMALHETMQKHPDFDNHCLFMVNFYLKHLEQALQETHKMIQVELSEWLGIPAQSTSQDIKEKYLAFKMGYHHIMQKKEHLEKNIIFMMQFYLKNLEDALKKYNICA